MKFIKDVVKLWNEGFNRGFNTFQYVLAFFMVLGAILSKPALTLFSMFNIIFFYFEPTRERE